MADRVETIPERIEIVLADDHAMVRAGLRRVLESTGDLTVVAEAWDVEEALNQTRKHRPRVVVLDLNMPGTPTVPAIARFHEASPGCAILVVTMQSDPAIAREALAAGAHGYVLKEAAEAELVEAVRTVAAGRAYLAPTLGAKLAWTKAEPAGQSQHLAPGSTFAGHRIDALIGRGGMGVVYRATDATLERPVALKLIAPDAAGDRLFRTRFERECRLAASIDHPHVVQIFGAGEQDGLLYLAMRYVDGTDLRRLLKAEGRLEPPRAVSLLSQIASALDEAHRLGLIHRDVKPANVLIAQRSGGDHAYLTDFGVTSGTLDQSDTQAILPMATVDYTAPEQAERRDVDARADVYSLGCVFFETLTGTVPFARGTELDKLWAHVHEPPPTLDAVSSGLPPALQRVLDRALAKDRGERQQSAGELAREARTALGS